jgi:hypothetical protein
VFKIGEWSGNFTETTELLLSKLDVKARRYLGKKYTDVVLGSELLDALESIGKFSSRGDALEAGRALQKAGIFDHVTGDHELQDKALFYHITKYSAKDRVLNAYRKWTDRVDPDCGKCKQVLNRPTNLCVYGNVICMDNLWAECNGAMLLL